MPHTPAKASAQSISSAAHEIGVPLAKVASTRRWTASRCLITRVTGGRSDERQPRARPTDGARVDHAQRCVGTFTMSPKLSAPGPFDEFERALKRLNDAYWLLRASTSF